MVNDAVLQTYPGRKFTAFVQVLMDGVATGEHDAGNEDFITNLELANFFVGKGSFQSFHKLD
jgi:hypothetical protein